MSFDRKIDQVCSHNISEEALFLAADRKLVRPDKPISSINSVRVRINGEVEVPSYGCQLAAEVSSSKIGPFTIETGVNDTLVVSVSEVVQTVTVPPGRGLLVGDIVRALSQKISNLSFEVTPQQRILVKTRKMGRDAQFMFLPGSTLAPVLGFLVNRQWRGRQTYPGWSLVQDPRSLSDRPTRLIMFDSPIQGFRSFVEINYATVRQECRRCGGLGIENDWRYTKTGNVIEVRNEALLIQEFTKCVYTIQGSNPFHRWIGTHILDAIGRKMGAAGFVQNFIVSDIRDAFRRWQSVKRKQEEEVGQFVSDQEYPFQLTQVNLTQSDEDPTVVFVTAYLRNRSTDPIQIERGVRIPLPDDILGTTAQDGLIRQSLSNFVLNG